jgi:transposase
MKKHSEYDIRHKAIQLYDKGIGFNEILQRVQRSKGWLSKWLGRYREQGFDGLKDKSRAPKRISRSTPQHMVNKVLAIREELESHKTRRSAFAGIGPEAIHWELERRRFKNIPSISTISRILLRHGKTRKEKPKRNGSNQPYPYIKAEKMGDLQQTDLVGPRHLRGPNGVIRFYSFHTIDVGGHTAFTSQCTNKQTLSLCLHLIKTWGYLGVPRVSQMDNEMSAVGGGRYQFSISQFIRLHMLLGIHMVFIPQGEPGRNASIESFNALWQERVLQRHNCPTISTLRKTSKRFLQYHHYGKPHRRLTKKENGTRFPGILKDQVWETLGHLPDGFSLDAYIDPKGNLKLPIARGKVSFIRKVDSNGRIEVNGFPYFIRRKLERQYVVATIFTHRKKLVVKHENKIIKSFAFPIKGHIINPVLKPS